MHFQAQKVHSLSEKWYNNHLSIWVSYESQVLHTVWCNITGETTGEIWTWPHLEQKWLKLEQFVLRMWLLTLTVCPAGPRRWLCSCYWFLSCVLWSGPNRYAITEDIQIKSQRLSCGRQRSRLVFCFSVPGRRAIWTTGANSINSITKCILQVQSVFLHVTTYFNTTPWPYVVASMYLRHSYVSYNVSQKISDLLRNVVIVESD